MESVESQIAEWRAYVENAPGVNGRDVDELEDHLRGQIAELNAAGLTADESLRIVPVVHEKQVVVTLVMADAYTDEIRETISSSFGCLPKKFLRTKAPSFAL